MKKNPIIAFTLIIIISLISGCSKEYEKEEIDSDIIVGVKSENNETIITARTERTYGCINYGISYTDRKSNDCIKIKFKNVIVSDVCLTAIGSASSEINLGNLEHEKSFDLIFKLNGQETTGTLKTGANPQITLSNEGNVKLG